MGKLRDIEEIKKCILEIKDAIQVEKNYYFKS